MEEIREAVKAVVKELFKVEVEPELTRPAEQFGDYSTNLAMQLAPQVGQPPREIAEQIAAHVKGQAFQVKEVAGPGFINFRLSDEALARAAAGATDLPRPLAGKVAVAEYSDPNPFKTLHAGHLYTTLVGNAVANLLEAAGAEVHRVNFGGDVGLHVGQTMWSILKELDGEHPEKLASVPEDQRLDWLSARYVSGNSAYEDDQTAKQEIMELNKKVYRLHQDNDHDSPFAQIYWTCRQWSYDGFNKFYEDLAVVPFEKYYPESATTPLGVETVQKGLEEGLLEKSDGAVVFKGEAQGLHTRVFLTSEGLPTYEAKDLGLALHKWQDYHFDKSVMVTGNEINEYMKVVMAVVRHFQPEIADRTAHLTHGHVKLAGGVKMSSRKGSVVRAEDVLSAAAAAQKAAYGKQDKAVEIGAVKYAFLKNRIGGDIIYDPAESVSLEGNSGPYIQYAHARARSVLAKTKLQTSNFKPEKLQPAERSLARKVSEYPEVVAKATQELMPHHITTYLYELAQSFNRFYEDNRVIGDSRQDLRLGLVKLYSQTLKSGLTLLGIEAPERM